MDEKDVKYWEKRKAQRMFEYMQSAEDTADQIAQVYWKSSGYINHKLDEIYNRFKVKHHLSDAEAKRLLNRMQDRTSFDELKSLLKQETDSVEKKELLKLIESPAYSARIQRFQDMQIEIDELMDSTYQLEKERSTRHYTDLMQDSYYKSIYDIQRDTGLAFSFSGISAEQIDKLLKSKWSGANYSQRIWNNTQKLAKDLKEELLINLMTGRTDREVAEIISNKFGAGAMEARRLVRTESNYIANEMEEQSYEECDIEKYMFVATLDKKTSKVCQEHDHKVYPVKDRQPGKNCPPMHPWCRSTTIAYLDDETINGMERRARDPETGEVYKIPGNMSYSEWHEKYVVGDSKKVNAIEAYQNRYSDRKEFDKYKHVFSDSKEFSSFEKFQDMKYNDSEKWEGFKSSKQSIINEMEFSDMKGLLGTLGDKETRLWYKAHDEAIPSMIDKSLSMEEQAKQACELRNTYRTQARNLMADQKKRKILDVEAPNKTFEELIESKMKRKGLTRAEAIRDIYTTATKTNKTVNKMLGLE